MIDLVIPLSVGSIWNNNEVKYCIRSIEKNFDELGKVFIIGDKPNFFNWNNPRLVHVECEDSFRHNKDANLINKVLQVCRRNDLSDDFIRASDDQIVLKRVSIEDFYPKYMTDLEGKILPPNNSWFRRLGSTRDMLKIKGKTTFHYESHYPMIYNKESFINTMKDHIEDCTINTYYFNTILDEHKHIGNTKITLQRPILNMQEFLKEVKGKTFLGYNNKGLREGMLQLWLSNEFREKSSFEL